jgi:hypothetical protein
VAWFAQLPVPDSDQRPHHRGVSGMTAILHEMASMPRYEQCSPLLHENFEARFNEFYGTILLFLALPSPLIPKSLRPIREQVKAPLSGDLLDRTFCRAAGSNLLEHLFFNFFACRHYPSPPY